MISTKEAFTSLEILKGPPIVLGDDSLSESLGKGRIDLDHGKFSNVLYANEASKLWHEIFGHLNYKYLSDLSEK